MRKIVQIATSAIPAQRSCHDQGWGVTALCDDGSVWDYDFRTQKWAALPPIPQDTHTPEPRREP